MSFLIALSLSTGFCCGVWAFISQIPGLSLVTWIGFAGCTAYFASGKHGIEGISTAFFSTMSGVASALVAVFISGLFPSVAVMGIIMTGIISGTMCIQSVVKKLWFIPGAFIGCFSSFAYLSSGANLFSKDIISLIVSLSLGTILALCCDKGGNYLFKVLGKKKSEKDSESENIESELN